MEPWRVSEVHYTVSYHGERFYCTVCTCTCTCVYQDHTIIQYVYSVYCHFMYMYTVCNSPFLYHQTHHRHHHPYPPDCLPPDTVYWPLHCHSPSVGIKWNRKELKIYSSDTNFWRQVREICSDRIKIQVYMYMYKAIDTYSTCTFCTKQFIMNACDIGKSTYFFIYLPQLQIPSISKALDHVQLAPPTLLGWASLPKAGNYLFINNQWIQLTIIFSRYHNKVITKHK